MHLPGLTRITIACLLVQTNALDTGNFDREFTSEAPTDSYVDGPMLSQTMQQQFTGWSYIRPVAGLGDAGGSVKDPSFGSVPNPKVDGARDSYER